jgi:hypothetical protein
MLHGLCFGDEAGARNLVFFSVNWLWPALKGTGAVGDVVVPFLCFVTSGCSCVRNFIFCGCRSHGNGCITVVMLSCYIRRYAQVCDGILRNTL